MSRIMLSLATLLGLAAPNSGRPTKFQILEAAKSCGLEERNLVFFVDDEGVDNVDVYPIGEADERFFARAQCLGEWAVKSGAAVGLNFKPRAN